MLPAQTWDPGLYARNARFVSDLGSAVLALIASQPGDIIDWLETFAQSFLQGLSGAARTEYLHEVRAVLEPQLRNTAGTWVATTCGFDLPRPRSPLMQCESA